MLGICRTQLLWCLAFHACSSTGLTQGATTYLGGAPGTLDLCPSLNDCFLHPLLSPMPQHIEGFLQGWLSSEPITTQSCPTQGPGAALAQVTDKCVQAWLGGCCSSNQFC